MCYRPTYSNEDLVCATPVTMESLGVQGDINIFPLSFIGLLYNYAQIDNSFVQDFH